MSLTFGIAHLLLVLYVRASVSIPLYTVALPTVSSTFAATSADGGYYRELLVDEHDGSVYVGGRSYVYKLKLASLQNNAIINGTIPNNFLHSPDFGINATAGSEENITSQLYRSVTSDLLQHDVQLLVTEQLAATYKLKNVTFDAQCRRQVRMLTFYYGRSLQLPLDPDIVCAAHARGLTTIGPGHTSLFLLRTGLFGTLSAAPTGVNRFSNGWPAWQQAIQPLAATQSEAVNYTFYTPPSNLLNLVYGRIANASRTCYACNHTTDYRNCINVSRTTSTKYPLLCYNPPAVENFMGIYGNCDYSAAPTRIIYNSSNMQATSSDALPGTARETCAYGQLASLMFAGYHPDQRTVSFTSQGGNGRNGNQTAVYILTEIGQEKQLDINHEAFMGYEDAAPLASSASLAIVRLLLVVNVNGSSPDGDVDPTSVLTSNPFKYTWVTSPATKFGRMVKTGNMATVPHRPRAVGIMEDGEFMYFFFREVDWESLQQPEYSIERYHYLWRSYDRTVAYPWEAAFIADNFTKQPDRTDPLQYWWYKGREDLQFPDPSQPLYLNSFQRSQHVYNPTLQGWQQAWNSAAMTGRVARVCKNDRGLPIGVSDASFFNLDNKMSLWSFQTLLKTRLTCSVPVPATPRSWRLRRDVFSFFWSFYFSQYPEFNLYSSSSSSFIKCLQYSTCVTANCPSPYPYGPACDFNKLGKDAAFRAFINYADDFSEEAVNTALFPQIVSAWKEFHWSYLPNFPTYSSAQVTYNELRDIFRIGNTFYGIFGSHLSEEQLLLSNTNTHGLPAQSMYGSAVCKYTLDDLQQAFAGPFKKRINNAWRPFDPRIEGDPVTPSPYSCDPDPIEKEAASIAKMNIDFADFTLPLEKELEDFDMRPKSSRLNFFEKDVEGSRTMWQDVNGTALFSLSGKIFDKIVVDNSSSYEVMYVATSDGDIYKVVVWTQEKKCWQTDRQTLLNWWLSDTNLMKNVWGSYFNMTQEAETNFPDDFIFESQWDCSHSTNYSILAVLKPFAQPQKIWDMKIHARTLIIATDTQVVQLAVAQCDKYNYCSACARDPYCGWSTQQTACQPYAAGLVQNIEGAPNCSASCVTNSLMVGIQDDVILDVSISEGDGSVTSQWYHNNTQVTGAFRKFMRSENGSLIIFNAAYTDLGLWELRDSSTATCIVAYSLSASDCSTAACKYKQQYEQWNESYNFYNQELLLWEKQLQDNNCLASGRPPS